MVALNIHRSFPFVNSDRWSLYVDSAIDSDPSPAAWARTATATTLQLVAPRLKCASALSLAMRLFRPVCKAFVLSGFGQASSETLTV
jgi:hypothetical protein